MTRGRYLAGLLCLLCCLSGVAQEKKAWPLRALGAVKRYIDSSAVRGIDSRYIAVPERPWQVVARCNQNQMKLDMTSHFGGADQSYELYLDSHLHTRTANNVGLWVGYRGYGIGYSWGVGRQSGSYFTAGVTGSSYGLNLRLRTFSTDQPRIHMHGRGFDTIQDGADFDVTEYAVLDNSIRVRSLIVDGYYLFNGKRVSYMAAYDQSAIQLRSAGSFLAGVLWHDTSIRYNNDRNASFISLMHDIGVLKIRQANIGTGYDYNWVPFKGMLVSALVMPMLTVYNRQEAEYYDCIVDSSDDTENDRIVFRESDTKKSEMTVTVNARLSLTYNWRRTYLNIYGQYNRFRFDHDEAGSGRIDDWYVNTAIGFRF